MEAGLRGWQSRKRTGGDYELASIWDGALVFGKHFCFLKGEKLRSSAVKR